MRANKLEGADVNYLSLVERGANRSPFKVMKDDKGAQGMIDLSRVLKGAVEGKAKIVGFVVEKGDKTLATEVLKAAGFPVDKIVEFEDGTLVVKQDDTDLKTAKDVVAIKMDDDFVLLAKGFDPYSMCEDMGFNDILKSQGFMPGLSMGMDALGQSIRQALYAAEDQKDAVAKIGEALDAFASYTQGLAKSIPQTAFKALESFRKQKTEALKKAAEGAAATDAEKAKAAEVAAAAAATATAEATKKAEADKAAADAAAAEVAKKAEEEEIQKSYVNMASDEKKYHDALPTHERGAFAKMKPEARKEFMTRSKGGSPVNTRKDDEAGEDKFAAAMERMLGKVTETVTATVNAAVEGVKKDLGGKIDAVAKTATEAKEQAAAVQKSFKNTVLGTPAGDEDDDTTPTRKNDEGATGCMDTAFQNVRKREYNSGIRRRGFGRHAE